MMPHLSAKVDERSTSFSAMLLAPSMTAASAPVARYVPPLTVMTPVE
jgi:hypothetical protein